jgi:hypothetical protein
MVSDVTVVATVTGNSSGEVKGTVNLTVGEDRSNQPTKTNDTRLAEAGRAVDRAINPNPYFDAHGNLTPLGMQHVSDAAAQNLPSSMRPHAEPPLLPPAPSERTEHRTQGH